ncbi:MAG: hypothetical protein EHM85_20235 [Desulfobacteraceae bacterium]|nr:MAG: hypothetical protein EHM85_20235 [Desulfobacteraceae bacterium]
MTKVYKCKHNINRGLLKAGEDHGEGMTKDQEKIIRDIVTANKEIINRLHLQNQALAAQLPEERPGKPVRGFIDLPDGKRLWYDHKAQTRWEKEQKAKKLTLMNREAQNG